MVGDRLPVLARRDGHVVEVAERPAPAEPLQLLAERDQLVIMHPDQVVRREQRHERQRKAAVRRAVGGVLAMEGRCLLGEAVQVGPERAVAETLVEVGDLPLGQVDRDVVDVWGDGALRRRVRVAGLPAPAEPEAADGGERRQQRGDEAARGPGRALGGRGRHPVRGDDHAPAAVRHEPAAFRACRTHSRSSAATAEGAMTCAAAVSRGCSATSTPRPRPAIARKASSSVSSSPR